MSQPTAYTRQYDFEDFQSSNPTTPLPADQIEAEYDALKVTTDEILANLALIQRDDGALVNGIVTVDSLSTAVKNLMILSGTTLRGDWADATAYAVGDVVTDAGTAYLCFTAHTSTGSIDTTKFTPISAPVAIPDDPVDDGKFLRANAGAGVWTTLTASMISDVVSAMQSVITAVDVGAARTALGSTTVGDALFIAASTAAARSAIGVTATGDSLATAASAAAARSALELDTVSQAEAEAGSATTTRAFTAQRVAQAIAAQAVVAGTSLGFSSVQYFTSSGTWTRPSGVRKVLIRIVGGGGGGSGGSAGEVGAGGGSGEYAEATVDVSAISSSAITIGGAGAGGATSTNGSNGGATSWADGTNTISANGGSGGVYSAGAGAGGAGGTGGTGGDFYIEGQDGGYSPIDTTSGNSGNGGSSPLGAGASPVVSSTGADANGFGGGGGGAHGNSAGGSGKAGLVIVYEFE